MNDSSQSDRSGALEEPLAGGGEIIERRRAVEWSSVERQRAEKRLRESEARLRLAIDISRISTFEIDLETDAVQTDDIGREIYGWEADAPLTFSRVQTHFHPADRDEVGRRVSAALAPSGSDEFEVEQRIIRTDGATRWIRVRGRAFFEGEGDRRRAVRCLGTYIDITEHKQAEDAVRQSRERLGQAMKAAQIYSWELNPTTMHITRSENADEVLGFALPEDLPAALECVHWEDREVTGRLLRDAVVNDKPFDSDLRVVNPATGAVVWLHGQGILTRPTEDAEPRFAGLMQNITERKQAQEKVRESQARFEALIFASAQIVWTTNTGGEVSEDSPSWRAFTGQTFDEWKGTGWLDAVHPDDRERTAMVWQAAVAAQAVYEVEYRLRHVSGEWRWTAARGVPHRARDGTINQWVGMNTDIHERKQAEAERERLLHSEQEARRAAEEANRLKDEFLATVSHELRTPMTAVLGWTHILRAGHLDGEGAARALETIERNARAQNQLVEDLLDVSRIITGKMRLDVRHVDPVSFIEAAVEAVRPAAVAKDLRLQKVLDPSIGVVSGDPERLQQVVWNLLTNAIKFTPKGGRVQVRLERINSHIEISITDTGQGIAPEFLPHVFDRFRQADGSTTRQHGGLGLGLAIVRHLVEVHGGTVHADSHGLGQGATFIVKLPLVPVFQQADEEERVHPRASQPLAPIACPERLDKLKILVVDDEIDTCEMLRMMLSRCGAEVTAKASAQAALAELKRERFDLLVSDIGMPGADGYGLIRRVRELPAEQNGRIPAVALTAYARTEDRLRALRSGYQMHVAKPVEAAELIAVIASLAGRSSTG